MGPDSNPVAAKWLKTVANPKTQRMFLIGLEKYVVFTGLSPLELITEASDGMRKPRATCTLEIAPRNGDSDFQEYADHQVGDFREHYKSSYCYGVLLQAVPKYVQVEHAAAKPNDSNKKQANHTLL